MKNIFKNFDKLGLLAFVAVALFAISWNTPTKLSATEKWVEVEDTGATLGNPLDQELRNDIDGTPVFPCDEPSGEICAVLIDFKTYTGTIANMDEANALHSLGQIEVKQTRYKL